MNQYIVNKFCDIIQKYIRVVFCEKCGVDYFHVFTLINGQNVNKICVNCNEMSEWKMSEKKTFKNPIMLDQSNYELIDKLMKLTEQITELKIQRKVIYDELVRKYE